MGKNHTATKKKPAIVESDTEATRLVLKGVGAAVYIKTGFTLRVEDKSISFEDGASINNVGIVCSDIKYCGSSFIGEYTTTYCKPTEEYGGIILLGCTNSDLGAQHSF